MKNIPVTFKDYGGTERTRNFWFGMDEDDLLVLESTFPGGFAGLMADLGKAKDPAIIKRWMWFVDFCYGQLSGDGEYFMKAREDEEMLKKFHASKASTKIYMTLMQSSEAAIDFIKGVWPESMLKDLEKNLDEAMKDPEFAAANPVG